jgi:hypothetical protein
LVMCVQILFRYETKVVFLAPGIFLVALLLVRER